MLNELDPILILEVVIVLIIIISQVIVFSGNRLTINNLKKIFPAGHSLDIELLPLTGNDTDDEADDKKDSPTKMALIKNDNRFSKPFQEIVESSNNYILRNKGGVTFVGLESIAERKGESIEGSIEQVLALPLYLGLLGTFTGVIIGLVKIAIVGVSDVAIQSFIGGVLVGMIASAFGLYLTVRSNSVFKNAKKKRDADLYDFLQFVRMNIVPRTPKLMPDELKKLQYNIASFTDEFVNYQKQLNNTLSDSLRRFEDLQSVFNNIRGLEPDFENMKHFLQNNSTLMERQVTNLELVNQRTADLAGEIDHRMQAVDQRIRSLETGDATTVSARTGNGEILDQSELISLNKALLDKMESSENNSRQMATHIGNLYSFLQSELPNSGSGGGPTSSFGFKFFTLLGSVAFALGIGIGIWYIANEIVPLYM
ncbi:hypothetical protein R9C00_22005 [Flammeovirgaceae bacterium SG7u.111]|nr:hypothetical protein [Flammeovirgaceae bacterium SG7u.132]WPO34378.1 hypothetical protein R9C00_22005 [Flammeovirgaceae bacterium SG7u.111]